MSIVLSGSRPGEVMAKVHPNNVVSLGNHEIPMEDFAELVKYVLTNTDLSKGDPRRQLVRWVRCLERVEGYNPGQERLEFIPLE